MGVICAGFLLIVAIGLTLSGLFIIGPILGLWAFWALKSNYNDIKNAR